MFQLVWLRLGHTMKSVSARALTCASVMSAPLFGLLLALLFTDHAGAAPLPPAAKMNAYVECVNRLSERAYDSRKRYFSWAAQSGPTGHEHIIYGTYTIYDTSGCRKNVGMANAMEPHDAPLEAAATAYVDAVSKLEPLLKGPTTITPRRTTKTTKWRKAKS